MKRSRLVLLTLCFILACDSKECENSNPDPPEEKAVCVNDKGEVVDDKACESPPATPKACPVPSGPTPSGSVAPSPSGSVPVPSGSTPSPAASSSTSLAPAPTPVHHTGGSHFFWYYGGGSFSPGQRVSGGSYSPSPGVKYSSPGGRTFMPSTSSGIAKGAAVRGFTGGSFKGGSVGA